MLRVLLLFSVSTICLGCVVEDRDWHHRHGVVVEEPAAVEVERVHVHPHAEFRVEERIH